MQVSCALHFKGSKRYIDILTKKLSTKAWLINTMLNIVIWIGQYTVVLREIQCFGLQFTAFFTTCHALKTWFELSRVKLYRNGLKGNKNYFDRVSGRFELSRVRVTNGKCLKESRGNRFCFELAKVRVIGSRLYISLETRLSDCVFDYKRGYMGNSPSINLVSRRGWLDVYSRAN